MVDQQENKQLQKQKPKSVSKYNLVKYIILVALLLIFLAIVGRIYLFETHTCGDMGHTRYINNTNTEKSIRRLQRECNLYATRKCNLFHTLKAGSYGTEDNIYFGYPMQTSDILNLPIVKEDGTKERLKYFKRIRFENIIADKGKNGESFGYLYSYTTTKSFKDENGFINYTAYVICAWPEEIGKTGTKIFITNEEGIIYWYHAKRSIKVPITKWPSNEELKKEWEPVSE